MVRQKVTLDERSSCNPPIPTERACGRTRVVHAGSCSFTSALWKWSNKIGWGTMWFLRTIGNASYMCGLSTHMTACPLTDPHLLSNLLMVLWLWASFPTMMRPHTWMRWRDLHHGARTTVSLWTWAKLKSWLWTSERDTCCPTLLLWSAGPLWRE